jgi:hypothetical protein
VAKFLTKAHQKGYESWQAQRQRCNNPKSPFYKNYGALGIKVIYSSKDFVNWWVLNFSKKTWQRASVGRIDHSGDYCFENIEMQEHSDNARDPSYRGVCGPKRLHVLATNLITGEVSIHFSMYEAARELKVGSATIYRQVHGLVKANHLSKYRFERLI